MIGTRLFVFLTALSLTSGYIAGTRSEEHSEIIQKQTNRTYDNMLSAHDLGCRHMVEVICPDCTAKLRMAAECHKLTLDYSIDLAQLFGEEGRPVTPDN